MKTKGELGGPNDRWPKRVFRHGFERTGTWFSAVGDDWKIPDGSYPDNVEWFLRWVGHRDCSPYLEQYPDRPMIQGHKADMLDARLRRLWDALGEPNRVAVMNGILAQIQPIWRARAIWLLPVSLDERTVLQGRWCRDTDPRFPKPETSHFRVKNQYDRLHEEMGMHYVKGRYVRKNWR